jgi:DNA topoisomerase-3
MKRFAVTISRQKRVKLPAGYATSGSICRTFLQQHAPKKSGDVTVGEQAQSPRMSAGVHAT